jgi:hypothetical protein
MQSAYLTINEQGISQQLAQFPKDIDQPFVHIQNSSTNDKHMDQYVSLCQRHDLPIIYISYTGKNAKVVMDLIYVPHCRDLLTDAFIEKMVNACEMACGAYNDFNSPGVITSLKVPRDNAQTLALSFLAIYHQTQGKPVPLPVFEHPAQPGPVRAGLELAKIQGYARAKGVADYLPLRYQRWCKSIQAPYICLWTRRAELAEIEATFPKPLSSTQVDSLIRFAEEMNIATQRTRSNKNVPHWLTIDSNAVHTIGSWLPGDIATLFIEQVVRLCRQAEMFPSVVE